VILLLLGHLEAESGVVPHQLQGQKPVARGVDVLDRDDQVATLLADQVGISSWGSIILMASACSGASVSARSMPSSMVNALGAS
jgi:hypothetical protein